jgi:predicted DNA-binding protein (MmcQ/YjbR family)
LTHGAAPDRLPRAGLALKKRALAYPEAYEEHPWGHHAIKVKGKAFVFLGGNGGSLSLSVKLPGSSIVALSFPFASPTEYGLGKSGWVTARFAPKAAVPVELLAEWIDESYRAIAPKRLVQNGEGTAKRATRKSGKKAGGAKKKAAR